MIVLRCFQIITSIWSMGRFWRFPLCAKSLNKPITRRRRQICIIHAGTNCFESQGDLVASSRFQ